MNGTLSVVSSFGVVVCFAASALGQAGAPTQRVRIPGIPDGTSIYPKSMTRGNNFVSIGCVSKSPNGEFRITDWRGAERLKWSRRASVSSDGATGVAASRGPGHAEFPGWPRSGDQGADRGRCERDSPRGVEGGIDFVPFPNLLEKGNDHRRTRQAETMKSWHPTQRGGSECELPVRT